MADAHCNQDHTERITIDDIDNLRVFFNGQPVAFTSSVVEGNTWNITIAGTAIPEAGELVYKDGDTVLKTVTVVCP